MRCSYGVIALFIVHYDYVAFHKTIILLGRNVFESELFHCLRGSVKVVQITSYFDLLFVLLSSYNVFILSEQDLLFWDLEVDEIVVPLRRLLWGSPTYSTVTQSTHRDNIISNVHSSASTMHGWSP